jgi:hypothetical protein
MFSFQYILTDLKTQIEKGIEIGKRGLGPFSPALTQCYSTLTHPSARNDGLLPLPHHGHCHLGPTIGALSPAKFPCSAPMCHRQHRFRPLPHSIPSLLASCCLTFAHSWTVLFPLLLRCHITLLHRPTAIKTAAPS